ncbi:MAG TPA: sodium:proton antiporter [Verrucomicrobiaceae bacterium]
MSLLIASAASSPNPWMVLPFVVLLLCVAIFPVMAAHHWERHYPKIATGLGAITTAYYLAGLADAAPVLHAIEEYLRFMALIASLYVISGGICIHAGRGATPLKNTGFLLMGAVLANVVGTTGASMLLIRPWIRLNRSRFAAHHVAFFIFIVSNAGGSLTPIGDPPLFLGYLRGVPFWWMLRHAWLIWIFVICALLFLFLVLDRRNFQNAPAPQEISPHLPHHPSFRGWGNLVALGIVLAAAFIPSDWKIRFHGAGITAGALLMLAAAAASYFLTPKSLHHANEFHLQPIAEVAWIFLGIFLTMIPALTLLASGHAVQVRTPVANYLACGGLSSLLDNAPTYLAFLAAHMGSQGLDVQSAADVRQYATAGEPFLLAISLGAVFFGAATYIGNGPNFMVKSICERAGVPVPSFPAYVWRWSLPFLLPVIAAAAWMLGSAPSR